MPEIRRFYVERTQGVSVEANNIHDAGVIASAAFDSGQGPDNKILDRPAVWGNTTSKVSVNDLSISDVT